MTFSAYDKKKIEGLGFKPSGNLELLDAFVDSGLDCVKIEGFPHKNAGVCAASIRQSIERYRKNNLNCISRGGEVFLMYKDK